MNETTKTLSFIGVAAVSAAIAFATRPGSLSVDAPDDTNQALFEKFTDPSQATSLKITRFDEALSSLSEIEIQKKDGIWTLPSHGGYPADAEDKIRDATTPFIDLTSLAVASDLESDHALYGVLEPGEDTTSVGDEGVGAMVEVLGENSDSLVKLVIGKTVKDDDEQRYVRRPGQSRVYIAKVDPDALPVRFEDWIEKDLLNLNGFDISSLVLKDYSFEVAQSFTGPVTDYDQRLELTVSDDGGTWKLDQLMMASEGDFREATLLETEELNQEKLGELKEALDGLEIVSVEKKPASLGADLRAGEELASDQEGLESLAQHGFYTVSLGPNQFEVLSADGEVRVQTKDGVEYVLRFGGVEGIDTEAEALKRFLLVSARVNDTAFPPVDLEPVPETVDDLNLDAEDDESSSEADATDATAVEDASQTSEASDDGSSTEQIADESGEAADEAADDSASSESADATEESADAEPTETEGVDESAAEAASDDSSQAQFASSTLTLPVFQNDTDATAVDATDSATSDAAASDTAASDSTANDAAVGEDASDQPATGAASDDASGGDEPATGGETASADATAVASDETEAEEVDPQELLEAERERITKENQRKIDERNDKVEKAQQKVRELNFRFADWYYVISEDVYKQIHLEHSDIIQEKQEEAEGDDAAAIPGAAGGLPAGFDPSSLNLGGPQ